jgi:hypothetical protein
MQAVVSYRVKVQNKAGIFVEDGAICNGTKTTNIAALKCTTQMLTITTNLNLAINDLIVV